MWRTLFLLIFLSFSLNLLAQVHYRNEIKSIGTFNELKGRPNTSKFGSVDAVKVLLDLKTNTLYFLNANVYTLHVDFCIDYLGYNQNKWKFNVNNYNDTDNRDFLMGTINHFENQNKYTLEFSVADKINTDQVIRLYKKVITSFTLTDSIFVFLNTNRMRDNQVLKSRVPTIDPSEIYAGLDYQALNQLEGYGILTFRTVEEANSGGLNSESLVVIKGTPNDLPPVAGVITTDFQTPLSHITLLCMNRGTPMLAMKQVWNDSLMRSMEDLPVHFIVGSDSLFIEKSTINEVQAFAKNKRSSQIKITLTKDTLRKELITPKEMEGNLSLVGGKAAHFGALNTAIKKLKLNVRVPEAAFAIPFAFYEEHIKAAGVDRLIKALPLTINENNDEILREQLDYIQYKIKRTPISNKLLTLLRDKVSASQYDTIRFRSSTNTEDIDGFNGAGLYASKSGILNHSKKSFEKAIKKVWSSTWSYKAFMERFYFGILQTSVSMGILCHRSFPNEEANGVVITKNLYRKNYRGFVVNAQKGDVSVVKPPNGVTCEQMICYSDKNDAFYGEKEIVEYISYSNILNTSELAVLSTDEVINLTSSLSKIKKYIYQKNRKKIRNLTYYNFGLDFEFKLFGSERQLYIKQMRPF